MKFEEEPNIERFLELSLEMERHTRGGDFSEGMRHTAMRKKGGGVDISEGNAGVRLSGSKAAPLSLLRHSNEQCEESLERTYPNHSQAEDGERWQCECGRVWVHICDEAEGCCWVSEKD